MNILKYFIFLPFIFAEINLPILINNIKTVTKPVNTENNITLEYYTGKWFQTATSRSSALMGTGTNFSSVTAIYECIQNCSTNNISVLNQGINNKGESVSISGFSYCKNLNKPGRRKLKFFNLPFIGNYWIIKLGPVINNKYDYAIVSGPISRFFGTRFSLYVLCRDINYYKENYEKEVKDWCQNNGFIFPWNKYVETK